MKLQYHPSTNQRQQGTDDHRFWLPTKTTISVISISISLPISCLTSDSLIILPTYDLPIESNQPACCVPPLSSVPRTNHI